MRNGPDDPPVPVQDGDVARRSVLDPNVAVEDGEGIVGQFLVQVDGMGLEGPFVKDMKAFPVGEQQVPFVQRYQVSDPAGAELLVRLDDPVLKQIDAGGRSDPDPSVRVAADGIDVIVLQFFRSLGIDAVGRAVIAVQSALRANPDITVGIFGDAGYVRCRNVVLAGFGPVLT